eukprot:CAMPEP_0198726766 /NCGR_PEP_ID=MMETSP1475-20131203/3718_1 /TAXON_ID= ORGANISM="Unidentified sp., Strain CCMP1999" /NCGR_SAMPLE_ID=MMETSP1475 /ASSEMBLY_ACC=CAM_ASM_001111 /LENGTH=50 /DNA_ID=CAMNT_0044488727 /DNA_START=257 /DNA_END=409 /DNA_ORIENTATION=+
MTTSAVAYAAERGRENQAGVPERCTMNGKKHHMDAKETSLCASFGRRVNS